MWCTASNRSPEEQGSTPVPHHAAGGRLSLFEVAAGRAGLDPEANKPGRGWTLQFSGLETLEKARQRNQLFTPVPVLGTPKTHSFAPCQRQSFAAVSQNLNGCSGAVPGALLPPQAKGEEPAQPEHLAVHDQFLKQLVAPPDLLPPVAPVPGARRWRQGEFMRLRSARPPARTSRSLALNRSRASVVLRHRVPAPRAISRSPPWPRRRTPAPHPVPPPP